MVFKNGQKIANSIKEEIIVQCQCNTHSFHIVTFDDDPEYYFELWTQNFYGNRNRSLFSRMKSKLKFIWCIIRGKEYRLTEFCLTDKDINELIFNLQNIKNHKIGGEK